MEEMYTLHELHGHEPPDMETTPEIVDQPAPEEPPVSSMPDMQMAEPAHRHQEEPEMELAQAYVRPQPLDGMFSPEEGLRMGTAFPNLSQPYGGRD